MAIVGAAILSLSWYLLGQYMMDQGLMEVVDGRLFIPVAVTLVLGGAIAAGNAYWNDGMLVSWLLVFGPVCGWLWTVFVQTRTLSFDVVIVPVGFAAFAGIVVGTLGYALGGRLRAADGTEPGRVLGILVGRNEVEARRWWLVAGGLFVVAIGVIGGVGPDRQTPIEGVSVVELFLPLGALSADSLVGVLVVLVWLGVATWPAYRRAGVFASWGIVFGPVFGVVLTAFVLDGISGSGPAMDATLAFVAALVLAVVLGSVGYLLGTVVRSLRGPDERGQQSGDPGT